MVDARKERCDADAAWQLLNSAAHVVAARGKKAHQWDINEANRQDILKMSLGPSGNLRAPTLRVGDYYVVGFNDDMYTARLLIEE